MCILKIKIFRRISEKLIDSETELPNLATEQKLKQKWWSRKSTANTNQGEICDKHIDLQSLFKSYNADA